MELTANHNIQQILEVCSDFDCEKRNQLEKHLDQISVENMKVLVFAQAATKHAADNITKYLRQDGWPALAIRNSEPKFLS
jgi:ATP-dependent RNA helicase DDX5/DBP2